MIKHLVLFKAREGVAGDDPRLRRAVDSLRGLDSVIGGIRLWEVGENVSERPVAVNYALLSAFDTVEDLAAYLDHPAHREVVELLKEVFTWQVCDYRTP